MTTGSQGSTGSTGGTGSQGSTGTTGSTGSQGSQGANGGFTTGSNAQVASLGVGTPPTGILGEIVATGNITAFFTSDIRLKENIKEIPNACDKLEKIRGVKFDWVEKQGVHSNVGSDIGVIAQEVEEVLPELVTTRDNGYKAVKYDKIVALLIQSNKELLDRIKILER